MPIIIVNRLRIVKSAVEKAEGADRSYSPMILTRTLFFLQPSNSP
jgi:hypothetical protein